MQYPDAGRAGCQGDCRLMMGSDGRGDFAKMDLSELHLSAVSEAMNQMMRRARPP